MRIIPKFYWKNFKTLSSYGMNEEIKAVDLVIQALVEGGLDEAAAIKKLTDAGMSEDQARHHIAAAATNDLKTGD